MADTTDKAEILKKALQKRQKPSKQRQRFKLWLCCFVSVVVVVAIVTVVWLYPIKDRQELHVLDELHIFDVNSAHKFTAGPNKQFEKWLMSDVSKYLGKVYWSKGFEESPYCDTHVKDLPKSYDTRDRFKECVQEPYLQGMCSSSWATSAAVSLSARLCISNPVNYYGLKLSAQSLLSCDTINRGCEGGGLDSVWYYMSLMGIVSEGCMSYKARDSKTHPCTRRCIAEEPIKTGLFCRMKDDESAKSEIIKNGPITALIRLYDDFLVYQNGIYSPTKLSKDLLTEDRIPVTHAVAVIGWGEEDDIPYWIIQNSFGTDWGEGGYGRIAKDGPVFIERLLVAGKILTTPQASIKIENIEIVNKQDIENNNKSDNLTAGQVIEIDLPAHIIGRGEVVEEGEKGSGDDIGSEVVDEGDIVDDATILDPSEWYDSFEDDSSDEYSFVEEESVREKEEL